MSTKKLSRTVIEGGRYNTSDRRLSNKEERAKTRAYMSKVALDPEDFEEEIEPERRPVYKEFSDKLNPMYRWLESQVGRVWDEVRSEISTKFDTRTTAGRHITFDHLLREIVDTESGFDNRGRMINPNIEVICGSGYRYYGHKLYYVDEDGILQPNISSFRRRRRYEYITEEEAKESAAWLQGRIIGLKGGKYYWFSPTEGVWKADWEKSIYGTAYNLKYYVENVGNYSYETKRSYKFIPGVWTEVVKTSGLHWEEVEVPFSYRQRSELSASELKHFKSFKESIINAILEYGKGR